MQRNLTWNKGIFDSSYQLFENAQLLSNFNFDTWRSEANASINGKIFIFRDSGLLNSSTHIFDGNNNLLGIINYDFWKSRTIVILNSGEQFSSEVNGWGSNWSISNFKDKQINYNSQTSSGHIITNTDDDLMLLAGLYIRERQNKNLIFLIIIAVVLVPIIIRGF